MDELTIGGKSYISARRASKEHKYHSDYLGQLIRAGKLDGVKVGRSWYISKISLKNFLSQTTSDEKSVGARTLAMDNSNDGIRVGIKHQPNYIEHPMLTYVRGGKGTETSDSSIEPEDFMTARRRADAETYIAKDHGLKEATPKEEVISGVCYPDGQWLVVARRIVGLMCVFCIPIFVFLFVFFFAMNMSIGLPR